MSHKAHEQVCARQAVAGLQNTGNPLRGIYNNRRETGKSLSRVERLLLTLHHLDCYSKHFTSVNKPFFFLEWQKQMVLYVFWRFPQGSSVYFTKGTLVNLRFQGHKICIHFPVVYHESVWAAENEQSKSLNIALSSIRDCLKWRLAHTHCWRKKQKAKDIGLYIKSLLFQLVCRPCCMLGP